MATRKQEQEHKVFEPTPDPQTGKVRLDRPLTGEEAAAQDKENMERLLENRRRRFHGRG